VSRREHPANDRQPSRWQTVLWLSTRLFSGCFLLVEVLRHRRSIRTRIAFLIRIRKATRTRIAFPPALRQTPRERPYHLGKLLFPGVIWGLQNKKKIETHFFIFLFNLISQVNFQRAHVGIDKWLR
jgi:hypothetical protein